MCMERLPVYKLVIDEDAEGMDFMGLVDYPAHGKNYITFSKAPNKKVELKQYFNDEKRIVKGVAIATDLQIYRRDEDGYEYNVVFTKEDTFKIMKMFAKHGYYNNVNFMHNASKKAKGIYLVECFFINDEMSNIPKEFSNQNLRPGSLIFSYWAEDDTTWNFIKENGAGFSIEGWFNQVKIKLNKKKKMKTSLMEKLGFSKKEDKPKFDNKNKDKYAEAVTVDGMTIMWEGDLIEGAPLFVVPEDGSEPILAAAGEYAIEVDGTPKVITVDESGMIVTIADAEALETEEEEDEKEKEVEAALRATIADYQSKFSAQESKLKTVAKEFDALKEAFEKSLEGKPVKVVQSSQGGYDFITEQK